jgi:hypothetical protein
MGGRSVGQGEMKKLCLYWEMNFISATCGQHSLITLTYKVIVFFSITFILIIQLHLHFLIVVYV